MDQIDNPPIIASSSNSFSFDFSDPFSLDFSAPFDTPLPDASSLNTSNNNGNLDAQARPSENQPSQISNQLACATGSSTPLPIWGTSAMTATIPTSVLNPQTDENRRIAPLPYRNPSLNGPKPQDQNPGTMPLPLSSVASTSTSSFVPSTVSLSHQANENIPPPPLPSANAHGKKRKSIPADETTTTSKPKKARKARTLEKQKQREAPDAGSDSQVPSVTPGHNAEHNVITNGVDPLPSYFPNQMVPGQHPHRALDDTVQPDDPGAILRPPMEVVKDTQNLQHLISTYGLPGVVEVDVTKQYPTRILEMIVAIHDPQSQRPKGAYFVPYVWFPEDPKRPHRVHKDDRCFWGRRIHEYHNRVQCGRIGYTIAGSPVLFIKKEEKPKLDSINYHILVNAYRQKSVNAQNQVAQSLPGSAVDQRFDATPGVPSSSHVNALPTQEQPPFTVQNDNDEGTSTAVVAQQYQQSFFPSTSLVNISADSQLNNNNNNDADVNVDNSANPAYNIYQGSSTDISQSFPEISGLTSNNFHEFQFDNSAPNIDPNAPSFNINDLPSLDLPSTDISQPLSELNNLASNTFPECQINYNDNYDSVSNVNTDASSAYTFNINDLPVIEQTPPNDFIQSFPDSGDLTANSSFHLSEFGNNENTAFNVNPGDALTNFSFNTNDLPIIEQAPSTQIIQSFPEAGDLTANPSFHLSQFGDTAFNVNPDALTNVAFNNDLPIIEQAPSSQIIQSFPEAGDLTANPSFHLSQFDNTAFNVNPDALTNFGFNTNDFPTIEQASSTEIIPSFPESGELAANPSFHLSQFGNNDNTASNINPYAFTNDHMHPITEQAPSTETSQTLSEPGSNLDPTISSFGVEQFNSDSNNEFDANAFLKLYALSNGAEGASTIGSTIDPAPSVDISQLEDMYTNLNWLS